MSNSKLYYIYAPMNAGKSLHLLAKAHNFEEHNIPCLLMKPVIDTRDGENVIHSRALGSKTCIGIKSNENLFEKIKNEMVNNHTPYKWILIDESQFLSEKQVNEIGEIVDEYDINIICYGLRSDFRTNLFPGSKRLFEIADTIEELKCSCPCGSKAIYNARLDNNGNITTTGNQVEIGGNDKYISLCRDCYNKKIKNNN